MQIRCPEPAEQRRAHLVAGSVPDPTAHRPAALVVEYHAAEPRQLAPDPHQHLPLPYGPRRRAAGHGRSSVRSGFRAHGSRRSGHHHHLLLHLQRVAAKDPVLAATVLHAGNLPVAAIRIDLLLPESHGQAEPHWSTSKSKWITAQRKAVRSTSRQCGLYCGGVAW
jgi:hypothetical protein